MFEAKTFVSTRDVFWETHQRRARIATSFRWAACPWVRAPAWRAWPPGRRPAPRAAPFPARRWKHCCGHAWGRPRRPSALCRRCGPPRGPMRLTPTSLHNDPANNVDCGGGVCRSERASAWKRGGGVCFGRMERSVHAAPASAPLVICTHAARRLRNAPHTRFVRSAAKNVSICMRSRVMTNSGYFY